MKQIAIQGGSPRTHTTRYRSFRGVDLSGDPTKIDDTRSPYAVNLVCENDNFPQSRPGWRTLQTIEQPVNGLFHVVINGTHYFLAHGGTKLYLWNETGIPQQIYSGVSNQKSRGFSGNNRFWLLTGSEYLVIGIFDGVLTVKNAEELAYVPTTSIARKPSGGGEPYEEINLLGGKRINCFLADGSSLSYQLDAKELDSVDQVTVNGSVKTATADYTVNLTTGVVTFKTAPPSPTITGEDNVKIEFTKNVPENVEKIKKCTLCSLYGVGTNDRVFLSGNPEYPATDWHSGLSDPAYFPDLGYAVVGSESSAIMGYHRVGEYLAIVKEDNQQDSTIFLRSASVDSLGNAVFPLKQGVTGLGAVSSYSFANVKDEPLFLARSGVYAITSNTVTAERTVQNRSYFVDGKLIKEEGLMEAAAVEWNGKYLLCVNSNCYVLDGNQNKSYRSQYRSDYLYECYYWENIPARCFLEFEGSLYFGTADGRICRFNTDMDTMSRYNDDGAPIVCYWSTKADDDGDFMSLKTIPKRGSGVMIKPYTRSSVKVLIRTDRDFGQEVQYSTMDIFDWDDIDFNRFTFNTNDAPQVVPINTKVRRYKTAQIIVRNDVLNEGFGVLGIVKRYQVVNYVK